MADGSIVIDTRINNDGINNGIREIETQLNRVGENLQAVGQNMSQYVTLPLLAIGAGALKVASDFDSSQAKIQNSLGVTANEAAGLNDSVKNLWKEGFGESVEDVTGALITVKQNIKGLDDGTIEEVTKQALVLANTFDADVNEVTRAGNNLMTNFGIESEKAFDLMAYGAQNGLDFSKEMFDNLAEYSGLFADMGYSADEYFQLLINGSEAGVYNLDYINDVMKEFQIRVKDGSKGTADAMAQMSESTQAVWESFLEGNGTVKDVSNTVLAELKAMDDQVLANQIGVGLFGTKWEDLESEAMYALGGIGGELDGVAGSMGEMVKVQEETFGQKFQSMLRNLMAALEPLGIVLMDMAEYWMPKISSAVSGLSEWFGNLSPIVQTIVVAFGLFLAALGPLIAFVGLVASGIGTLVGFLAPLFAGLATSTSAVWAFGGVIAALTSPIAIIIGAIGGLIAIIVALYKNNEDFRNNVQKIWQSIKEAFKTALDFIQQTVETVMAAVSKFFGDQLAKIKAFWDENGKAIMSLVEKYFGYVQSNIEMVMGIIKGIFEAVWPIITNVVKIAWETIKLIVGTAIDLVLGIIQTVMKLIQGDWEGAWNTIKATAENIMNNVVNFFKNIDLVQTGKDIIQGLIDGISSMASAVWDKAKEIADSVKNTIADALKIQSPSVVMKNLGKWIPEGLADGMIGNTKAVIAASQQMASAAVSGMASMNNKYDYSRKMDNTIYINSSNPSTGIERTLRRMAFEF